MTRVPTRREFGCLIGFLILVSCGQLVFWNWYLPQNLQVIEYSYNDHSVAKEITARHAILVIPTVFCSLCLGIIFGISLTFCLKYDRRQFISIIFCFICFLSWANLGLMFPIEEKENDPDWNLQGYSWPLCRGKRLAFTWDKNLADDECQMFPMVFTPRYYCCLDQEMAVDNHDTIIHLVSLSAAIMFCISIVISAIFFSCIATDRNSCLKKIWAWIENNFGCRRLTLCCR